MTEETKGEVRPGNGRSPAQPITESKLPWHSITIRNGTYGILALLAFLAGEGLDASLIEERADLVYPAVALLFFYGRAIWGRFRANTVIARG